MRVDFHIHTSASDGTLEPASIFYGERIAPDGLAITDHDTVGCRQKNSRRT